MFSSTSSTWNVGMMPTELLGSSRVKATVSRNELTRQMEEMQQVIVSLQAQLPVAREEEPSPSEHSQQVIEDLRRHIMILQSEMERLQASQEEIMREWNDAGAPPGYAENL